MLSATPGLPHPKSPVGHGVPLGPVTAQLMNHGSAVPVASAPLWPVPLNVEMTIGDAKADRAPSRATTTKTLDVTILRITGPELGAPVGATSIPNPDEPRRWETIRAIERRG